MTSVITPEGNKYVGEVRTVLGIEGLIRDGTGLMEYTNGDIYKGEWRLNQRCGGGELIYSNGSVYDGEWRSDRRHGYGYFKDSNGDRFEGLYKSDSRNGVGTLTMASGECFTGAFRDDQRHGRGILTLSDGTWFEGTFTDNKMNGHGTMRFTNNDVYEGEFQDSKMHGKGIYRFSNGDLHEGYYCQGVRYSGTVTVLGTTTTYKCTYSSVGDVMKLEDPDTGTIIIFEEKKPNANWNDGKGLITSPNGDSYHGSIKAGNRNGYGILTQDNGDMYEGEWECGLRHGYGTMQLREVRQLGVGLQGWRYFGHFYKDKFSGHGQLLMDLGDSHKYTGNWVDGARQGHGVEESDGTVYEGMFDEDKKHGRGMLTTRDGIIIDCIFNRGTPYDNNGTIIYTDGGTYTGSIINGIREGYGTMQFANGDVYNGEYNNDKRNGLGTSHFINGDSHNGLWVDEVMHGQCTVTYSDGTVFEGEMCNGAKEGAGVIICSNALFGANYRVNYCNDVLVSRECI